MPRRLAPIRLQGTLRARLPPPPRLPNTHSLNTAPSSTPLSISPRTTSPPHPILVRITPKPRQAPLLEEGLLSELLPVLGPAALGEPAARIPLDRRANPDPNSDPNSRTRTRTRTRTLTLTLTLTLTPTPTRGARSQKERAESANDDVRAEPSGRGWPLASWPGAAEPEAPPHGPPQLIAETRLAAWRVVADLSTSADFAQVVASSSTDDGCSSSAHTQVAAVTL